MRLDGEESAITNLTCILRNLQQTVNEAGVIGCRSEDRNDLMREQVQLREIHGRIAAALKEESPQLRGNAGVESEKTSFRL